MTTLRISILYGLYESFCAIFISKNNKNVLNKSSLTLKPHHIQLVCAR